MRLTLIGLAALVAVAVPYAAPAQNEGLGVLRPFQLVGERFAPVTLAAGQGVRVVVANVLMTEPGARPNSCPVVVRFLGGDGTAISSTELGMPAGAARSIGAAMPPGIVRAIVTIRDAADPNRICALRASFEVFNTATGATLFAMSSACLGGGECSLRLPSP
jgi:hypothetical protein